MESAENKLKEKILGVPKVMASRHRLSDGHHVLPGCKGTSKDLRDDGGRQGGSKGLRETRGRVTVAMETNVSMCDRIELGISHS
jgi:hypothetical protein